MPYNIYPVLIKDFEEYRYMLDFTLSTDLNTGSLFLITEGSIDQLQDICDLHKFAVCPACPKV